MISRKEDDNSLKNYLAIFQEDDESEITTFENIEFMANVFKSLEKQTAEIAEELFEFLFNASDLQIIDGEIPIPKNVKSKFPIANYIKALNRLFKVSRKEKNGSIILINRKIIQDIDKKTYSFCICLDGGTSLDILCEIVNEENRARTPKASSVKISLVARAFDNSISR